MFLMNTISEAVHLMESNQSEKAIKLLDSYLPVANEEEKFAVAEFYLQWGFLEEANLILKELLLLYPNEGEIKVLLADIYIELEKDEAAIELLNEIKESDPTYLHALLQLADLFQSQGLFEVAELKLMMAKQFNPDEQIIDFALGELLFSIGEYKRAITYYEKIVKVTNEIATVSIYDRLAESHAASGNYEVALDFYKEISSENPDTLFKHGFTAYQANRKDIAIKAWEKVIELDPNYHAVYYELSKAYAENGLPEEAYATSKKGLKVDEFNKELYYYAGILAHQMNEDIESERLVRHAVALDPDYKEAILFLIGLFKAKDKQTDIVELIEEIKNVGAEDPLYDWEIARAFNELELFDHALKHYKEAYNNLRQDSDFLKEYGYFLTEEGKIDEAIPVFESYFKQQPLDTEIEEYLERLKQSTESE